MKVIHESFDLARLHEFQIVAPDVETDGLYWYRDRIFGVALAAYDGKDIYTQYFDIRERPQSMAALRKYLPQAKRIVNHHIKFDVHFLRKHNVRVPLDRIECTMVRAALINEHEGEHGHDGFDLDTLCRKYISKGKETGVYEELAKLFGGDATRKVQMKNLHRAPARVAAKYACPDPALAIELWLWQEQEIARQDLHQVWDLERRLTPVLVEIEAQGVRVDTSLAAGSVIKTDYKVAEYQTALNKAAGKPVNANSSPQMRALFGAKKTDSGAWVTDSGYPLEKTDGGEASINKDVLIALAEKDPRAKAALGIRKMVKAKSFLKDHIIGHAFGDHVYPNYNQTRGDNELGTGTGRFSINDPALQQIPARDEDVARVVRPCFIPDPKHKWGCGDWEQFEFRWFAHYVNDTAIIKAYADNPHLDYHQIVADMTGIPRKPRWAGDANAKQINLGLVFGMGPGKMAAKMGLPYVVVSDKNGREWLRPGPEATAVFEKYHAAIPGVRKLLDQASSIARSRGHVLTAMGRHIRFPRGLYTHKAGGLVFQGTSADCIKTKMIELQPIAKREGFKILLSVHDELDFDFPAKEADRMAGLVKKHLETFDGIGCPIRCRVPILSSVAVGSNWCEASI